MSALRAVALLQRQRDVLRQRLVVVVVLRQVALVGPLQAGQRGGLLLPQRAQVLRRQVRLHVVRLRADKLDITHLASIAPCDSLSMLMLYSPAAKRSFPRPLLGLGTHINVWPMV